MIKETRHLNELAALNLIILKYGFDITILVQDKTRSNIGPQTGTIKKEIEHALNNVALRRL